MPVFKRLSALLFVAVGAIAVAQVTQNVPNPAKIKIRVLENDSTQRIPEEVFGSFLEPIGNSINNGIVSEILVNRSFESGLWNHVNLENLFRDEPSLIQSSNDTGIPLPWQSLNEEAGNRFELHVGKAANSWQSLVIMGVPNQLTGIRQKVYLPVHRTLEYRVSVYAKHLSGPERLRFVIQQRNSSKIYAEATVKVESADWQKYSATLRLTAAEVRRLQAVDFGISVEGTGRIEVDQASLTPADSIGVFDPDAVQMAKEMNLTELRLGGNFSSYYHWRDGIGAEDQRMTMENIAWGIPEYNILGTDEFLKLCDLIHAVPQFNINMGSGTPEEAVDWIRYIRQRYSGPILYELGNELYGKWQVGYPTVDELGPRTLAFSKAVRAADPKAKIIATGLGPTNFEKWNGAQYSNPPGTFDLLSLHYIEGVNHPHRQNATPDFVAASAYASTYSVGANIDKMMEQVKQHPELEGKVHFAVTEWLFNSKGFGERNFTNEAPSWMNEGGAVLAAGFLNTMLRHSSEIHLSDMTGLMEFAGIWKKKEQVYAVPAYYAFRMYSVVKGDKLLRSTTDSGTYDVTGGMTPAQTKDIPYLDVVATKNTDGSILTLLCVNRSLDQDLASEIDLGGFKANRANVEQIKAFTRYEMNDEVEPKHVVPLPSSFKMERAATTQFTFPRESVTVLRFYK